VATFQGHETTALYQEKLAPLQNDFVSLSENGLDIEDHHQNVRFILVTDLKTLWLLYNLGGSMLTTLVPIAQRQKRNGWIRIIQKDTKLGAGQTFHLQKQFSKSQ